MGQSASIWWAAGYYSLHPGLKDQIDWFLNHSDIKLGPKARHTWEILTEKFELSPKQANLTYHVAAKIKRRGWSTRIHYELEAAIQPFLTSRRPFRSGPIPPEGDCEEIDIGEIISLEVKFPARGANELTPPPEDLYRLFRSVRRGLEKAQKLLEAIETRYWHTASFQIDQRPGERYLSDSDVYLFWAKRLFDQLCDQQPAVARSEVVRWPRDDAFFFDKLKLHAWTNRTLFSGDLVGGGLTNLGDGGFWDSYNRRELLHLLRDRWTDISPETRVQIENRIVAGRAMGNREDAEESQKRNSSTAASVLGWLRRNGCTLSDQTIRILPSLQLANPSWNTGWEESADNSLDGRTGFVAVKEDPARILDVPISKIIEVAEKNSTRPFMEFTEHRPFSGLVKQRPQRALAALAYQARRDIFPLEFLENSARRLARKFKSTPSVPLCDESGTSPHVDYFSTSSLRAAMAQEEPSKLGKSGFGKSVGCMGFYLYRSNVR